MTKEYFRKGDPCKRKRRKRSYETALSFTKTEKICEAGTLVLLAC